AGRARGRPVSRPLHGRHQRPRQGRLDPASRRGEGAAVAADAAGSAGVAVRSGRTDLVEAMSGDVPAKPRVFIKTFGCQMNVYDSDKIVDVLHAEAGYEPTDNADDADRILF